MNETNLTPMEAALLDSLQKLSVEHEQRLDELEQLLKNFAERSKDDSSSDRKSVDELKRRLSELESALGGLSEQVDDLEMRLKEESPILQNLSGQLNALLKLANVND